MAALAVALGLVQHLHGCLKSSDLSSGFHRLWAQRQYISLPLNIKKKSLRSDDYFVNLLKDPICRLINITVQRKTNNINKKVFLELKGVANGHLWSPALKELTSSKSINTKQNKGYMMGCLGREASEKTVPEVEKRTEFNRENTSWMYDQEERDEPRAAGN